LPVRALFLLLLLTNILVLAWSLWIAPASSNAAPASGRRSREHSQGR
jgi:hypothetical protein